MKKPEIISHKVSVKVPYEPGRPGPPVANDERDPEFLSV